MKRTQTDATFSIEIQNAFHILSYHYFLWCCTGQQPASLFDVQCTRESEMKKEKNSSSSINLLFSWLTMMMMLMVAGGGLFFLLLHIGNYYLLFISIMIKFIFINEHIRWAISLCVCVCMRWQNLMRSTEIRLWFNAFLLFPMSTQNQTTMQSFFSI